MINTEKGTEMIRVEVPADIASDITIWTEDEALEEETMGFVHKLCAAKLQKYRNRRWYEVEVTEEELQCCISEILEYVITKWEDECDQWYTTSKERAEFRRYIKKVQTFIDRYTTEEEGK